MNFLDLIFKLSPIGVLMNGVTHLINGIKSAFNPETNIFNQLGSNIDVGSSVGSYLNKVTGAGPTGADLWNQEMNERNMALQVGYERELRQTAALDTVKGYQAAGINPAMMYGQGPVSASAPSGGSPGVTAGNFSDLIALMTLPAQLGLIKAQTDNTNASAGKTIAETEGVELDNQFKNDTLVAREDAVELANSLSRSNIVKISAELDNIAESTHKLAEEAKTEESKRELNFAAALLDKINAQVAVELLPYQKSLTEAKTQSEKNYAALMAVQTLYQHKLISSGYIDELCKQLRASATSAEAQSAVDTINSQIRTGQFGNDGSFLGKIGSQALQGVVLTLDQLKGIANFGIHLGKSSTQISK